MRFRTEIGPIKMPAISHGQGIVMLGSCFTDSVGERLQRDGFDTSHNPLGTLYNPASIRRAIALALGLEPLTVDQLLTTDDGLWHCLDFATKYNARTAQAVLDNINGDLDALGHKLRLADTLIITLGTAHVYERIDTLRLVGNCHKLPNAFFRRYRMNVDQCRQHLDAIMQMLPDNIKNVIFTVSPIRHTADGLHGNGLSKATLLLAVDEAINSAQRAVFYFPSYEIMIDDLRDYRFYAEDMKHPSPLAVDYIYERFADACFSPQTKELALEHRKAWLRAQHRPLL